jgi:hypothetical protein
MLLISIPIILFIIHFKNQLVSIDIEKWAYFGEYFGGILSPIISLLSLIIIGYLTFIVSKYSNEENKNLHYLKLKLEAYDELAKQLPILATIGVEAYNIMKTYKYRLNNHRTNDDNYLDQTRSDLRKNNLLVLQFGSFLHNFKLRYSHLFHYNFNSRSYQESIKNASILQSDFQQMYDKIELENNMIGVKISETADELILCLTEFINDIREEIV